MLQTMFLCAGLGTRLMPLTREIPKPLVPLGDRPLLCHLAKLLEQSAGRLCAVNAHHQSEKIQAIIDGYLTGVVVSHERELLGTAGGVRAAAAAFNWEPLVVWNGDILTRPNLAALVRALERAKLALLVDPLASGEGNVGLDASGRVVRLRRHTIGAEASGGNYVGILAMRPECFTELPRAGCLIGDVAMKFLDASEPIMGVPHLLPWSDLGSIGEYHRQNLHWLRNSAGQSYWIDRTASVSSGVELNETIVGRGASVRGQGYLERVVLWPGATCSAPLADAIVTTLGEVVSVPKQ